LGNPKDFPLDLKDECKPSGGIQNRHQHQRDKGTTALM
jgi:hypothetical protein